MNFNKIKFFIQHNKFSAAALELEKMPLQIKTSNILSLLYRFTNQFEKDQTLAQKMITTFPSLQYFHERKKWHEKNTAEKLEFRAPFHGQRDPSKIPSQEILEQLCFVSASDHKVFPMLVELLESIKNTRLYKDIPINILDVGMTENQKHYLIEKYNVRNIIDPGWKIHLQKLPDDATLINRVEAYKAIFAKPYLANIFQGYRYYFWLDTDTWIQDERTLDLFLLHTKNYGLSYAPEVEENFQKYISFHRATYNINLLEYIDGNFNDEEYTNQSSLNIGVFCIDAKQNYLEQFATLYRNSLLNKKPHFNTEQTSFNIIALKAGIPALPRYTHALFHSRHPEVHPTLNQGIFCYGTQVAGIIHMLTPETKINRYNFPVQIKNAPLKDLENLDQNYAQQFYETPQKQNLSISYKTWPWKDKEMIKRQIIKLLEELPI